jgi:hypothetical protein
MAFTQVKTCISIAANMTMSLNIQRVATMNRALYVALLSAFAAPALSADVSVSISIGQPGFYGQIDIGNIPAPPVIYAQPVVIVRSPEFASAQPIYLHVPPGHEKNWRKHCAEYNACGRPVYFVRDDWYNNEYVPRHRHDHDDHDGDSGHGRGHHKDHDRGEGHHEDR